MAGFDLNAQLQLQQPTNISSIVSRIQKSLGNIGVNVVLKSNVNEIRATSTAIGLVDTESQRASKGVNELGRTLGIAARRFGAISIATGTFLTLVRSFKNAISEAISFEREMNKIEQATGATGKALKEVSDEVFRLSKNLGVSSSQLGNASRVLAQAGFSAKNAAGALKILAQTELAATFDGIENTTEGMIAILQQFGREAVRTGGELDFLEKSFSAINLVSKKFAVESSDIISAVQKTGGSFEAAGGDLNELIALFTSVRATTRESADTIATAFRTIFTRVQRTETIDALKELGITLQDAEGKFIGPLKAIENLSIGLSVLDTKDFRFSKIVEELGGFRQIGKVIPLIKQFAITQEALNVAQNASGSLAEDQATAQKSLAIQIVKVREEFQSLINTFVNGDAFKSVASGALEFARVLIRIGEAIEPLLPLIASLAAAKLGGGFASAIGSFAGIRRKHNGGPIHRFASGGFVPGSGNGDTVPAMLTPGEFVLKKASVQKIGSDTLQKLNTGGLVKSREERARRVGDYKNNKSASTRGGILSQGGVGILLLEPEGKVAGTNKARQVSISKGEFAAAGMDRESQNFNLAMSGITDSVKDGLAGNIRSSLVSGMSKALDSTSELFAPQLKINTPLVADKYKTQFANSIGEGTIGTMFEALIASIADPTFSKAGDRNKPFDYIGSVAKAERLFDGKTRGIKYRDAKDNLNAFGPADFKTKILNQAKEEALYGGKTMQAERAQPKKSIYTLSEAKSHFGVPKANNTNFLDAMAKKGYNPDDFEMVSLGKNKDGSPRGFNIIPKGFGAAKKFAKGGPAGSDTVPAMLTPGEFVVKKAAARKIGYGNLSKANSTGDPQYLATGGVVQHFAKGGLSKAKAYRFSQLTAKKNPVPFNGPLEDNPGPLDNHVSKANVSINKSLSDFNAPRDAKNNDRNPGDRAAERFASGKDPLEGLDVEETAKVLKLYDKQILKGVEGEKALQNAVKAVTNLREKQANANSTSGPTGSTGPNNPRGPVVPKGPQVPGKDGVDKDQGGLAKSSVGLGQNFLFMGGAITSVVAQMGFMSSEMANATAQAAVMASSIYGIGSTLLEATSGLNVFGKTSKVVSEANVMSAASERVKTDANNKTTKSGLKLGGGMDIAQGALMGFAIGMAAVQFITAGIDAEKKKSSEAAEKEVNKVKETGKGSLVDIEKNLADALGKEAKSNSANSRGTGGAAGGAIAGAAIGSMFAPVIGTIIGGIVGGLAGGVFGARTGTEAAGTTDPNILSAKYSAQAQYTAAKASYDFAHSMDLAREKNLTGSAALDDMSKSLMTLDKATAEAEVKGRSAEFNRTAAASDSVTWRGKLLGYKPEQTEEQKKQGEAERESLKALKAQKAEAITAFRGKTDETVGTYLSKSKKSEKVDDVLKNSGADKAMKDYEKLLRSDGLKSEKEINDLLKAQKEIYEKQVETSNENLNKQNALVEGKKAEIALQLKTGAILNGLVQSARDFAGSQSNIDRVVGGAEGNVKAASVSGGEALSSIGRVGNQAEFANIAKRAAAPLGPAGKDLADQVTGSAKAIEILKKGLTETQLKNLQETNKLQGQAGEGASNALLNQILGPEIAKSIGPELRKSLSSSLITDGGPQGITQETVSTIVKQFETVAQDSASALKDSIDKQNDYLNQYDQVTTAILSSMNRENEARAGLVDIVQRGQDRMTEVFAGRMSERQQEGYMNMEEDSRNEAAQAKLGPKLTGLGVKAGDVGSVSGALNFAKGKINENNATLQNKNLSVEQIGELNTKNKLLADTVAKTTEELGRLTDQSARASDIMGQISKERGKADFVKGEIKDFVLGGQEERQAQVQTYQGANVVARTGSFQALPEEMRKSVGGLLDKMAELEPDGPAAKVRDHALKNDATQFALNAGYNREQATKFGDAAVNAQTPKEVELINQLKILNKEEQTAQQKLIDAEMQNTVVTTQLLGGVNTLLTNMGANVAQSVAQAPQVVQNKSRGGPIYASTGMFIPRGTDTVPAMLTPGEFVMNRQAVARYGEGFMQSINGGSAPSGYANGGVVYKQSGGRITRPSGGNVSGVASSLRQAFEGLLVNLPQAINSGLEGFVQSMTGLSQSFSNMHMTHEINVNGQLNIGGINSEAISKAISDSLGEFVVQTVKQQFADKANSLKAG